MNHASNQSQLEIALENLPPDISPLLERRLLSAPWTQRGIRRRQVRTIIYLTVFSIIAFLGLTPQGRAFAQTIIRFFTTTNQQSLPLSKEELDSFYTPVPTYIPSLMVVTPLSSLPAYCSNSKEIGVYQCEIQHIEKQLNTNLKEFSTTPPGWIFKSAGSYPSLQSATTSNAVYISYQTSNGLLLLRQGAGDFPLDLDGEKVPLSAVQPIKIASYDGEYVSGGFVLMNGATEATWEASSSHQRIRWQADGRWFEILESANPGATEYLDREALISLAAHMVYQPDDHKQAIKVNFDFIPTIALAEKVCGFHILQPKKLPQGAQFDHARYDPERKNITLIYAYGALRIIQTPLEEALIKNLNGYQEVETVKVGNSTGQFGVSPNEKSIWDSATPPVFPVNNSYSILLWQKDGMVYQIHFDQSFSVGAYLTKEQMIEIGKSLR